MTQRPQGLPRARSANHGSQGGEQALKFVGELYDVEQEGLPIGTVRSGSTPDDPITSSGRCVISGCDSSRRFGRLGHHPWDRLQPQRLTRADALLHDQAMSACGGRSSDELSVWRRFGIDNLPSGRQGTRRLTLDPYQAGSQKSSGLAEAEVAMLLHDRFTSILDARDAASLLTMVVQFARALEFDKVTAFAVQDHAFRESEFFAVDNAPVGFAEITDDRNHGKLDPVMQHCKNSSLPIAWTRATYLAAGRADMWETQAQFGYISGICLATHLPAGKHFCIGVDRDGPLPASAAELSRAAADLQLFATYAQEVALGVLLPCSSLVAVPELTPREIQCLQWTMEGKTGWEVGCILGISEQTAVRHLNNATHKLNCVSKHHAVVRALRLGVIR